MSTETRSLAYLFKSWSREKVAERSMTHDRGLVDYSHRGYPVLNLKALEDYSI